MCLRVVGVFWDNTRGTPKECMTQTPPHYFDDDCFATLDPWVKSATDAGVWVILALRSEIGAGQNYNSAPGTDLFRNATLRAMALAMWTHVASHYAGFERIAAYERRGFDVTDPEAQGSLIVSRAAAARPALLPGKEEVGRRVQPRARDGWAALLVLRPCCVQCRE